MDKKICNDELFREVAKETGKSEFLVRQVIKNTESFIKAKIENGDYVEVKLPFFGKFKPLYKRLIFNERLKKFNEE